MRNIKKVLAIGRMYDEFWDRSLKYNIESTWLENIESVVIPFPYIGKIFYCDRPFTISDYNAIVIFDRSDVARILYELLVPHCLVIGNPYDRYITCDKARTSIILDNHGIKTVESLYSKSSIDKTLISSQLGKDIVIKPLKGSKGEGCRLYRNNTIFNIPNRICQRYINCNNTDERWIVVDGNVVCAKKRHALVPGEFRTHDRYGGHSDPLPVTQEMKDLGKRVYDCFPESVWMGIDVIKSLDGEVYIGEVNSFPFLSTIEITGYDFLEDIYKYILCKLEENKAKK